MCTSLWQLLSESRRRQIKRTSCYSNDNSPHCRRATRIVQSHSQVASTCIPI